MTTEPMPLQDRKALPYSGSAEYAGVSVTSIRRAVEAGHLVRTVPPGQRKPLILRESLDRWLEAGKNS